MAMSSTNTSMTPRAGGASRQRLRNVALLGGFVALVIAGLASLAAATGWDATIAHIADLTWLQVAILLALSLVNYGFRGLRWHLFARRLGLPTTVPQDMRHFLGGFAMSVTPGRVGELVRMRWLRRETGWAFERTAPLVLVDRASDLAAMSLILALAVTLSAAGIAGAVPVILVTLVVAYIATRPQLLSGVASGLYRLSGAWPRLFGHIRIAARSLARFTNWPVMSAAAVLGIVGWIAEGYAFDLLLVWMGADIGFWAAVAIFVFATLAGGLTGLPGGVGGAEAAMIGLLMLEGIPPEVSVPATLIIRLTTLWFAIGIGLAVFPFAERFSIKAKHALETR